MSTRTPPMKHSEILADCNNKLSAQVQVQRNQINELDGKLQELELQREEWKETILCVQRLWEELNSSIAFLDYMATGSVAMTIDQVDQQPPEDSLEHHNPFLAKLLSTYLTSLDKEDSVAVKNATKALTSDVSELETALRAKMATTLKAATHVMEALDKKTSGGEEGEDTQEGSSTNERKLLSMISVLKNHNDKLQNDKLTIQELEQQLADKEDELLVAQRKILQYQAAGPTPSKAKSKTGAAAAEAPSTSADVKKEEEGGVSRDEVDHLNKVLADRNVELDAKEAALVKAERSVRELKDKLASERGQADRAGQRAAADIKRLNEQLDRAERRVMELRADKDKYSIIFQDQNYKLDQGAHAIRQLEVASSHIRDLENRIKHANDRLKDTEAALRHEQRRRGNAPTIEELQKALTAAENDVARLKEDVAKHRAEAENALTAKAEAAAAAVTISEASAQVDIVRKRLEAARAAVKSQAADIQNWKERDAELRLFVEVTHSVVGPSSNAEKEVQRLKASETALKNKIESLQQKLTSSAQKAALNEAEARCKELQTRIEALEEASSQGDAKVAALEKQISALQADVAAAKSDYDGLLAEMDTIVEDAEEAKKESKRLVSTIVSRDEDNAKLGMEVAEAAQQRAAAEDATKAAHTALQRAEQSVANFQHRIVDLERQVAALRTEVDKAQSEARSLSARAEDKTREAAEERSKREAADAERTAAAQEIALRVKERDEEADRARQHANKAERLERENTAARDRLERLRRNGQGGVAEELQQECDILRKMINCNVCHARQKDVMITKCNHMFCSQCIKANLDSRNRKCPGCGVKFGENDVRNFYFT